MVDLDSIRGVDSARSAEAWNGIGRTVLENVNELRRVFDPSSGMTGSPVRGFENGRIRGWPTSFPTAKAWTR